MRVGYSSRNRHVLVVVFPRCVVFSNISVRMRYWASSNTEKQKSVR